MYSLLLCDKFSSFFNKLEITIREQQRKLLYEESRRREKFRRQKIIYLPVLKDVE